MTKIEMNRINLTQDGLPEVSDTSDTMWAVPEAGGWRVYAALGETESPVCSRVAKAASAEAAIRASGNPFGDLSTGGWRRED